MSSTNISWKLLKGSQWASFACWMGWRKGKHFCHLLHAFFCQGADLSSSLPCLVIGRELKEILIHSSLSSFPRGGWGCNLIGQSWGQKCAGIYLLLCCQGRNVSPSSLSFLELPLPLVGGWPVFFSPKVGKGSVGMARGDGGRWSHIKLCLLHVLK